MPESIVFNEDCMVTMGRYPDKYFDLAVVDPPYFKGVANKNFYGADITKKGVKRLSSSSDHWDDNIPNEEYFNELIRVSKNHICWGVNYYPYKNMPSGMLIWDKVNDSSTFSKAEIASCSLIDSIQMFRYMWNGMLQQDMKNKEIRIHPTQKPVALYDWIYSKYAKQGDKILDTHLGSGSNRIAAYKNNLDFIACEIDKNYFTLQDKRFNQHISQQVLF